MGCGCGKQATARRTQVAPTNPDPGGALLAAAQAGGPWQLTTSSGTIYAGFPTIAAAREAQRVYGGSVDRAPNR
jgi:hypothetical protein